MTEKKHSPGPLEARPEDSSQPDGLHMVVDLARSAYGATVCTASYCTKADAVLYAAAPALLEAARALIKCDEARKDVQPLFERATALARAAIDQAEGRV